MNPRALENLRLSQDNENVRRYLAMLPQAEGVQHGYNTAFGNRFFEDLSKHPNIQGSFTADGKTQSSGAAGAYQFIKPTWARLEKKLGLADFSGPSQDAAAVELLRESGSLEDVLAGRYGDAVKKDGPTWASLPGSPIRQKHRSVEDIARFLGADPQFLAKAAPAPAPGALRQAGGRVASPAAVAAAVAMPMPMPMPVPEMPTEQVASVDAAAPVALEPDEPRGFEPTFDSVASVSPDAVLGHAPEMQQAGIDKILDGAFGGASDEVARLPPYLQKLIASMVADA